MKLSYTLLPILLGFSIISCSKDSSTDKNPVTKKGQVDTSHFSNTQDANGFKNKGKEASSIYSGADQKFSTIDSRNTSFSLQSFNSLLPLENLFDEMKCQENFVKTSDNTGFCTYLNESNEIIRCEIELDKEPICEKIGGSTSGDIDLDSGRDDHSDDANPEHPESPRMDDSFGIEQNNELIQLFTNGFESCDDAFKGINGLFKSSENNVQSMLKDLETGKFLPPNVPGQISMQRVEDPNAAISYEMTPTESIAGLQLSGKFSGSANENMVVIKQEMNMAMDFAKMMANFPGAGIPNGAPVQEQKISFNSQVSVAADIQNQIIDFSNKFNLSVNAKPVSMDMLTTVKGGNLPAVSLNLTVAQEGQSGGMLMTVEMLDANTLRFTGSGVGQAATADFQSFSATVSKNSDGSCKVSN